MLLSTLLYLNYAQGLERKWQNADNPRWLRMLGSYCIYLLPFALAFLGQFLFYKQLHFGQSRWFWFILLVAPALFTFRVHFNLHEKWVQQQFSGAQFAYATSCINWIVRVFVLVIPVLLIWWWKDRSVQPLYGFRNVSDWKPYWIMLLAMLPLIAWASTQGSFLHYYPRAQLVSRMPINSPTDYLRYLWFELSYGFDFFSIELFFRGFLVLALYRLCGSHCILPIACFYCSIHLGKPLPEAISSFFGGALLGIVAMNTGSIWGGLLVHLGIAWLMEIGGSIGRIFFPHQ